jgi:hypothetical protein
MNLKTTLNIIRAAQPCADGWAKLLKSLPASYDHDATIAFSHILESNGLDDAIWALRCVLPSQEKDRDREARLFACDCAENVLHLLEVACRFANGEATAAELSAARAAAWNAAWDAADAADAAWAAAADAWASWAAWAAAGWATDAARDVDAAWATCERTKQKEQFVARFCKEASK